MWWFLRAFVALFFRSLVNTLIYIMKPVDQKSEGAISSTIAWIQALPPVTKTIFLLSCTTSYCISVLEWDLKLDWNAISENYEIWRIFTAALCENPDPLSTTDFSPIDASYSHRSIVRMMFVYFLGNLEKGFGKNRKSMLKFLAFSWLLSLRGSLYMENPYFMESIVMSATVVTCEQNPYALDKFWIRLNFIKSPSYFPLFWFSISFLVTGRYESQLIGIIVGYFYLAIIEIKQNGTFRLRKAFRKSMLKKDAFGVFQKFIMFYNLRRNYIKK